ncbi:MAG: VOC family protein [Rhodobacteraceae bacterium]|nr:VOC family protein [Paracoccaceae bacterium]
MIKGLSHITLVVADLDEMQGFLETALDSRCVYHSDEAQSLLSETRFYQIGDVWIAIIKGDALPGRTYNHIAFKIDDADFETCQARLEAADIDLLPTRLRVEGQGRSLYFYGPGNHLFELHTGTLEQRLAGYIPGV